MLSVLSNGTLHLSEELSNCRQEVIRLRGENATLAFQLHKHRASTVKRLHDVWVALSGQSDIVLLRSTFMALVHNRTRSQVCFRLWSGPENSKQTRCRDSAWAWLWRRKVFSVWRRVTHLNVREELERRHKATHGEKDAEASHRSIIMEDIRQRNHDLESLLACERNRVASLEVLLMKATQQVQELQATLKESYVKQFEAAQQREKMEGHFTTLLEDLNRLRQEREVLSHEAATKTEELSRSAALHAERELRLLEASGELSLAEEVIDDIAGTRCSGLQRFFERYNLPRVLISLFRKVLELTAHVRLTKAIASGGSAGGPNSPSPTSKLGGAAPGSLESEVRRMSLTGDGRVSRSAFASYIDSLHLDNVSAAMVAQVVLALLGLDLGDGSCDSNRFLALLVSSPPWEQLDFATALWGAASEPAAVVEMHRRSLSRAASAGSSPGGFARRHQLPGSFTSTPTSGKLSRTRSGASGCGVPLPTRGFTSRPQTPVTSGRRAVPQKVSAQGATDRW